MNKKGRKVIGICCSDFQLSLKPPVWRSAEEDWLEAQKRPLLEIEKLSIKYDCPVFCAGDIFERWNSPPELTNWALDNLPSRMYAIIGQHDLPLHNIKNLHKSAFWSLILSHKVKSLHSNTIHEGFELFSFNYGEDITKPHGKSPGRSCIAIAHQYNWIKDYKYPGAPKRGKLGKSRKELKKYDIVIFGDNHRGFLTKIGETTIFNCGTIIRRKIDEKKYRPQVGLLFNTGRIKIHYLDISKDKYLHVKKDKLEEVGLDTKEFFDELERLGSTSLDFEEVVKRYFEKNKVNKKVKQIILQSMEG